MAKRKIQFVNDEIYHIVMRAIDGLELFPTEKDYLRMMRDLFEFNDRNPVLSTFRVVLHRGGPNVTPPGNVTLKKKQKLLVEILCFCLMPNHVHLLVRQVVEGGISQFMKKFGGYANYYNKKHQRKGHLFQSKFEAVHIQNDEQLKTVFVYIHTNPITLIQSNWKERGIKDMGQAIKYLENYPWSSYSDYLGKKNLPSLTSREFLTKVMGGPKGCRKFVNEWLRFKRELADFNYVAME